MPRVLVVDDQADVRTMISIVLRIHHFEIVEAESAASALKLFETASFDLAIVDIFLQGTNGSDLITTLRARVPGLPVVAISGMTALDFLSETPELSDVVCLQKPFRPPDLMRAIEAAQGSRRQSAEPSQRRRDRASGIIRLHAADPSSAGLPLGASQAIAVGGVSISETGSAANCRCGRGTDRQQTRPSGRQSNSAWPPSCNSMLAITLRVPNPRDTGFSTGGPPVSTHMILRRPAWSSQPTDSRPDSVDRAPYFAELVTSSCSASATRLRRRRLELDLRTGQFDLVAGGIGRQLLVDQFSDFGALPARQRKHGVHPRQRVDPPFDRTDIGLHVLAARQPDDGLRQRQRVLGAVIDLPRQQVLPLLGLLALGDIDGDAADADDVAALVGARRRRAGAPAHLAVRPDDAEFRLVRFRCPWRSWPTPRAIHRTSSG